MKVAALGRAIDLVVSVGDAGLRRLATLVWATKERRGTGVRSGAFSLLSSPPP